VRLQAESGGHPLVHPLQALQGERLMITLVFRFTMVCGHHELAHAISMDDAPKIGSFRACHECPPLMRDYRHKKVVDSVLVPENLLADELKELPGDE
jgi:hypothetical protein